MKEKLESKILNIFKENNLDEKYAKVSISNRPELCDYQINSVFQIAKEERKNPIEVGEHITNMINNCSDFDDYFDSVVFAKPGFINIKISDKLILNELNKSISSGNFGIEKIN